MTATASPAPQPAETILAVNNIEVVYDHVILVLKGVSLTVPRGGIVAILGANGAGKTTTLRALCGMIRTSGEVLFAGKRITGRSTEDIVRLGIAHVPQGRGTLQHLTVEENLLVGALLRKDRKAVAADLDHCRSLYPVLAKRTSSQAGGLSGGEQQMLAISRALMSRPKLLLLDEPSLGLAPRITSELFASVPQLRDQWGVAMLVVEQNANLALQYADSAVVLETGSVAVTGPASEVAGRDEVRRAYLGD